MYYHFYILKYQKYQSNINFPTILKHLNHVNLFVNWEFYTFYMH